MARSEGKRRRPWKRPKRTVSIKTWNCISPVASWSKHQFFDSNQREESAQITSFTKIIALKKERKTWEEDAPRSRRARKVVTPPLNTASPILPPENAHSSFNGNSLNKNLSSLQPIARGDYVGMSFVN